MIRFMANNFAELTLGQIIKSSELASFPFSNSINRFRSKAWKPSGYFLITATNNKLYINDGVNQIVTITPGNYLTPAILATEIQTQLNAVSSGWSCIYSTSTFKFSIQRGSSGTLRKSQSTNAIWNTIGYIGSIDISGLTFLADEQRNHTMEFAEFDFGYSAQIQFCAIIGPLDEVFSISSSATVKLKANNLQQWDSPPLEVNLTVNPGGILQFIDETNYRYWRIEIIDKFNPNGPEGISIGHIYLGDYEEFSDRPVSNGFQSNIEDPTITSVSESGALYFDQKTKYAKFNNLNLPYLKREMKSYMQQLFHDNGVHTPFYISFDPELQYTDSIDELTKYVFFTSDPKFIKVSGDRFTSDFELREAI